jgi:hypothetical protein
MRTANLAKLQKGDEGIAELSCARLFLKNATDTSR